MRFISLMTLRRKNNCFECWHESLLSQFSSESGISIEIKSRLDNHSENDKIQAKKFVCIIGDAVKKDEIREGEDCVKYFECPLNNRNRDDNSIVDFSDLIAFFANHGSGFFCLFSNGLEAFI